MNIVEALADPNLFAPWFKGSSWRLWQVVLKATFNIPLTQGEQALFARYAGGRAVPPAVNELWLLVGRRGGKSIVAALIAVYLAAFLNWKKVLAPGECGVGMLICPDRRQGRVVMGYIAAFFDNIPLLNSVVERRTQEAIYLKNGVIIEIHTASFRTIRGYTVLFAVCDEIAFWRSEESANPDKEILNALRPAMATVPNPLLVCLSTPYSRRGALWEAHRRYYGQPGPVLVWQAGSQAMNPTLPDQVIRQAYDQDPAVAAAEYDAQFRRDIEGYVSREAVEGAVMSNRRELPPQLDTNYTAFVDPSGGSQDSMTLAISHMDEEKAVLDAVREVHAPFSPQAVVEEFATLLRQYQVHTVSGDRYGGEWPADQFRQFGINYEPVSQSKSDLYRELLPALNSGRLELLDHPRLITQLCNLERRTTRSGRSAVDHPPGSRDDVANAVAGCLVLCQEQFEPFFL